MEILLLLLVSIPPVQGSVREHFDTIEINTHYL